MTAQPFDDLTDVYEATIDWPKRLANEQGFYQWLFHRVHAQSVLDAACGTGRHAALFHSWNLRVEGADLSPAMIARCQRQFGQSDTLRWIVRPFDQPAQASFDAVVCVGNSLALAPDHEAVRRALTNMLAAVRPGGALVLHVLNLWRMPDGPPTWQKCLRANLPQGDSLIIKGVHRATRRGFVDLLITNLTSTPPALQTECVPFLGLESADLEQAARAAGSTAIEFYGNYQRHPYHREQSQDLIIVAIK